MMRNACTTVTEVNLSEYLSDQELACIVKVCTNVRELQFENYQMKESYWSIICGIPNLEELYIEDCYQMYKMTLPANVSFP